VDARREQLVRMLQRRRRMRLLAVCVGTAVLCGAVAAILAPKVLVGGVPLGGGEPAKLKHTKRTAKPLRPGAVLDLDNRLDPDPRETRNNSIRWNALSEPQRQAFFKRYWRLMALDPAEREALLDRYKEFRRLPADRQTLLRQRARNIEEFIQRLSPQDRAVLASMSQQERAARLLELQSPGGRP
jgi:hypothetical protein